MTTEMEASIPVPVVGLPPAPASGLGASSSTTSGIDSRITTVVPLPERLEPVRQDSGICCSDDEHPINSTATAAAADKDATAIKRTLTDCDLESLRDTISEEDLQILERMKLEQNGEIFDDGKGWVEIGKEEVAHHGQKKTRKTRKEGEIGGLGLGGSILELQGEELERKKQELERQREEMLEKSPRLPYEIVYQILGYVKARDQKTFAACCKLSRVWYAAAVPFLYVAPKLSNRNYHKFIATICPSVSNLKPSPLSHLIRELDLSDVEDGPKPKPYYLPRLLRRTQDTLQKLVVPKGSFTSYTYNALSNCKELRSLDLSNVQHSMKPRELIDSIKPLDKLEYFKFPRSPFFDRGDNPTTYTWPDGLKGLFVAGGISDTFFSQTELPSSLNELAISHCPFSRVDSILRLIRKVSATQLRKLTVTTPLPRLAHNSMDQLLALCPCLEMLCVAVDYITADIFTPGNCPEGHPLQHLDLDSSGMPGTEHKLDPNDVFIPIAEQRLPRLRTVGISASLDWKSRYVVGTRDLVFLLEQRVTDLIKEAEDRKYVDEIWTLKTRGGLWEFLDCRGTGEWRKGGKRIWRDAENNVRGGIKRKKEVDLSGGRQGITMLLRGGV